MVVLLDDYSYGVRRPAAPYWLRAASDATVPATVGSATGLAALALHVPLRQ